MKNINILFNLLLFCVCWRFSANQCANQFVKAIGIIPVAGFLYLLRNKKVDQDTLQDDFKNNSEQKEREVLLKERKALQEDKNVFPENKNDLKRRKKNAEKDDRALSTKEKITLLAGISMIVWGFWK